MDLQAARKLASNSQTDAEALAPLAGLDTSIDRLLARHLKADGALLETLSHSSDKATRKAVVLNPNAPKEVLLDLAPQFPGDFFHNPAFDWMLLEDPDMLFNLGKGVLKNMLKRPDCPEPFMRWAVRHGSEDEALAVVMNAAAPEGLVRAAGKRKALKAAVEGRLKKPDASSDGQGTAQIDEVFEDAVKSELAALGEVDAAHAWDKGFLGIAQWPYLSLGARLAVCQMTPNAVLAKLLPAHAEALSRDGSSVVRSLVAQDPDTPLEIVKSLARDKEPTVKKSAKKALEARTKDATVVATKENWSDVLSRKPALRKVELAAHPSAPGDFLESLGKKADLALWRALAANPSCPEPLRTTAWQSAVDGAGPKILLALAVDPAMPKPARLRACERLWGQELAHFFEHAEGRVWPELRRRVYTRFGDQQHVFVPVTAEQNARMHDEFCATVLSNPTATVIGELTEMSKQTWFAMESSLVSSATRSSAFAVRLLALSDRHALPEDVVKVSRSVEWKVRLAIARNPAAPPSLLAKLASDPDQRVSAQARATVLRQAQGQAAEDALVAGPTVQPNLDEIVSELLRRLGVSPRDDDDVRGTPAIFPWEACGTPWWAALSFRLRLGTTRFVNPFHVPLPPMSAQLLGRLATHDDPAVRRFAARNPAIPLDILNTLANDPVPNVRYSAGMNPLLPEDLQRELAAPLCEDGNRWYPPSRRTLLGLAENMSTGGIPCDPTIAPGFLAALASSEGLLASYAICLNPRLPASMLPELECPRYFDKRGGYINPSLDRATLEACAVDVAKRSWVAGNPALSPELLTEWMEDPKLWRFLGLNPALPVDAMERIRASYHPALHAALVRNPALPRHLIESLSSPHSSFIGQRLVLIENPCVPYDILNSMRIGDTHKIVRDAATIATVQERQVHHLLREALCPDTATDRLRDLSKEGPWVVRLAATRHPAAGIEDVDAACAEIEAEIHRALDAGEPPLMGRQSTPYELRSALRTLGVLPVDAKAVGVASTSRDWLERGACAVAEDVPAWILRRLLGDEVLVVRELALWRLQEARQS